MASAQPAGAPERPSASRRAKGILVRLGALSLLVWVIQHHGGVALLEQIYAKLRHSWPLMLLPWAVGVLITISAYRNNLPGRGRAVPYSVLVTIERSGSALNQLLPLGNASSNLVKVALLRHWYSLEAIVAAGIWGGIATGLCNVAGALGPFVVWLVGYGDARTLLALCALNVAIALPASVALSLVKTGLSARVVKLLSLLPAGFLKKRRDKMLAWARRLDTHLASATGERRADFLRLIGWRLLGQGVRVLEIWLGVVLLGLPGGILVALVYNAGSRAVTQLFSFVPGRLGVMELTMSALFASLGLTAEQGLSLVLVLRLRYIANLVLAFGALSGTYQLAQRYPPRDHSSPQAST